MNKSSVLQKLYSENKQLFYSFECLPLNPSDEYFMSLIESLTQIQPLFVSVTWHLKSDFINTQLEPLVTAITLQKHGLECLLHLAATGLKEENVLEILNLAKEKGISNIFALRGDRTENSLPSDFPHACDLVRFIRKHFKNQFTICVGGYPTGHPDCSTYKDDLKYLKEKVDAGADFIITQIFFDAQDFINFVNDCRQIGIKVPIIPGIMPIQSRHSIEKIVNICKVRIPEKILAEIRSIEDDKTFINYGISKAVELIKEILQSSVSIRAAHFFTLNSFQQSKAVTYRIEEFCAENFSFNNLIVTKI